MMKINLRNAKVWSEIPDFWKLTKRVNAVSFRPEPKDKGLVSIMSVYASDDDLRPVMTGINFDDKCIVSTDAHRLFAIPNTGKERGLFEIGSDKKIDGTFPNYNVVVPTSVVSKHYVNIQKLKTFCNVVTNGNYSNESFSSVRLFVGKTDHIKLKVQFLIEVLDGFEKLGYTDVHIGYVGPTKNFIFCTSEKDLNNPLAALGKNPVALLMPLMDNQYKETDTKISAQDDDRDTSLLVYYDLEQDQIVDADGKIVRDWEPRTDWGIPYWNKDEARVVKKVTESTDIIPVLGYASVKDGVLTATNLDFTYSLVGVDVEDGLYEITNLSLKDLPKAESENDFPMVGFRYDRKFNIKGHLKSGIEAIAQASAFVSKDQLRPSMTGVHLRVKDGTETVQATNAYIVLNLNKQILNAANDYDVIVGELKLLVLALETFDSPMPKIATDLKNEVVKFVDTSERHHIWVKAIDSKYPDVKNAIPEIGNLLYALNIGELKSLLKNVPPKLKTSVLNFTFDQNNVAKAILSTDGVEKEIGKISGHMKDVSVGRPENYVGIMPNLIENIGGNNPSLQLTVEYALKFFDVAFKYGQKEGGNLMIYSKGQTYVKLVEVENEFEKIPQETAPSVKENQPQKMQKPVKQEPAKASSVSSPTKEDVEATVKALKYLADAGNEDAKKTVKALSILLENM